MASRFRSCFSVFMRCIYVYIYHFVAPLVTPPSPIELILGGSINGGIGLVGPISQLVPPSPPMAGMNVPKLLLLRHAAELSVELTDGFSPLLRQSHEGHIPNVGHGPIDPVFPQHRMLMAGAFSPLLVLGEYGLVYPKVLLCNF